VKGNGAAMVETMDKIITPRQYNAREYKRGEPEDDLKLPLDTIVAYGEGKVVEHFAKRVPGGFKSKLGKGPVMFHETLDQLISKGYGQPIRLYIPAGANDE